jgi:dUTP pyrophosphatase
MFSLDTLKVIKLSPEAKLPTRATEYDAGYDLYALNEGEIAPNTHSIIPLGIAIRLPVLPYPYKIYGSIRSRSGLSAKNNIEVGAGVIDYSYTKEVCVILHNHNLYNNLHIYGDKIFKYKKHDRIAQLILEVHVTPDVEEVKEFDVLKNNSRNGGFGSTGN